MFKKFRQALQNDNPNSAAERANTAADESTAEVNLKIPRTCYYKDEIVDNGRCPQCDTSLVKQYGSYMVALLDQQGKVADAFNIAGPDIGYYCPACPTVVLDKELLTGPLDAASAYLGDVPIATMMGVLGLLDVDAMKDMDPQSSEPYPIIPFETSTSAPSNAVLPQKTQKSRPRKPKRQR